MKFGYIIPFCKIWMVKDLAYIFLRNIVSIYGVLWEIILDKDKFFILKFWITLVVLFRIKKKLLIVFYL